MTEDSRPAQQRIDSYLQVLRRRIRALIYARAAAVALLGIALVTVVSVALLSRTAFAMSITVSARLLLLLLFTVCVIGLLWRPLRRLNHADGADEFERRLPAQQGRIQTYLHMQRRAARGESSAFAELLAEDAARVATEMPPQTVIVDRQLWIPTLLATVALAALLGLLLAGPAQWGYGSRHLLLGMQIPREAIPERRILVRPGSTTVRRDSDVAIVATMQGFAPDDAAVYMRFDDESAWQRAPMQTQRQRDGSEAWVFRLYALRGPMHYYVVADNARSEQHTVGVADLPKIERVRLTYSYPQWTGLTTSVDESQRDIRAVATTQVKVEVFADAPLQAPALMVNGQVIPIAASGKTASGSLTIERPGNYFVGAQVLNDFVPLTEDYQIEVVADEKPSIEILKPGRDWRASSIEEIPIRIQARDDFRLQDVELRYAVNGGQWQVQNLDAGQAEVNDETLLRLEDLGTAQPGGEGQLPAQLAPGDLVSYYAVAKDRSSQVQTDLFMVQVQPFELRFTQSSANGGGNSDDDQSAISVRQKEILLATWNLQRSDTRASGPGPHSRKQLQENAAMLAELQTTLAQQARTVAERTRVRASQDEDPRVQAFIDSMDRAASAMDPAAGHLKQFRLAQAVPAEQQALQLLLRAEAAFREVQVSMQQAPTGGGADAARNFSEMFELEMDLQKNQYETQSQFSQQSQRQDLAEAIRKLKDLAARQEQLAQQVARNSIPPQEQRWRQEQLRREAQDLKRRLAELSREQQSVTQQARDSRGQSAGQSGGSPSIEGQSADRHSREIHANANKPEQAQRTQNQAERERLAATLESLTKALEEMRVASLQDAGSAQREGQNQRSSQSAANDVDSSEQGTQRQQALSSDTTQVRGDSTQAASAAGRNLRQALQQIDNSPQQGLGETVERLAQRAARLTASQRDIASELQEALDEAQQADRRHGSIDPQRASSLAEAKQKMSRDLTRLQADMRETVHEHRNDAPAATRQMLETLAELEASNVNFRIGRSADELLYGRARDVAAREGLIEEALQPLEYGLRAAATLAAQDSLPSDEATAEQMLANIAELRRSLQQAQAKSAQLDDGEGRAGSSQQSSARQKKWNESSSQASANGGVDNNQGSSSDGTALKGLAAWNPPTPRGAAPPEDAGHYRETAQISEQLRRLANHAESRGPSAADLATVRRMTSELRRLANDPLIDAAAIAQLVDRIELTALAAAARTRDPVSSRTSAQNSDTPEYRDAVAEYYRRLGAARPGDSR